MESWLMPMLCGSADVVPEGSEWVMERKYDGWRAVIHVKDGQVRLFGGRNGNSYSGKLPYIEKELLARLPNDTAIDGELIAGEWGDVQGVMTRGAGPHVPSEHVPALTFVAFDLIRVAGSDIRSLEWHDRRALLVTAELHECDHVDVSKAVPASQAQHDLWIEDGAEGSVCKLLSSRYVNSRSKLWVKIKPQTTDEARVIGFKPGKAGGKFDGMVGAFEVEMLETAAKTTVKCGDDARHREATDHPERWLGVVIEVAHHGIQASGKPRHPQFFRRRDDRTDAPASVPTKRRAPKVSNGATGRMRNYGAMKDEKLRRVIGELESKGDAYQRALNGSGNPQADLEFAINLARERGILRAAA
jgi:ATP-dependent DNA ligase